MAVHIAAVASLQLSCCLLDDMVLMSWLSQVELEQDVLSADNTWTICAKNYLGEALRRRGQYEEASKLFQETRHAFRRAMGAEHPETIGTLADVGQVNLNLRNFTLAGDLTHTICTGLWPHLYELQIVVHAHKRTC